MNKAIWEAMLTAHMNALYWQELAHRFADREKWAKIFLALMASGTVASWGIWQEFDIGWKVSSGLAAVLAVALPILDWPKKIAKMNELKTFWRRMQNQYEFLWLQLDKDLAPEAAEAKFKALRDEEVDGERDDPTLPSNDVLLQKCQERVLVSRGLTVSYGGQ